MMQKLGLSTALGSSSAGLDFPTRSRRFTTLPQANGSPVATYSARPAPPGGFYITKPADFRPSTCLHLRDHTENLGKVYANLQGTSKNKKKIPPKPSRSSKRLHAHLDKNKAKPIVEISIPKSRVPAVSRWMVSEDWVKGAEVPKQLE
ncbi:hypothetical protein NP233_g9203 [Leucocoprinus birnbaumii]|uniref:Uncharacterized protein n=1 Tax=Leucocoprinus birnbaumii TaxID=56174 RepID=A0AAD5VLF9_9AGAR|nr:hypothetical protein NP233_g9203 [Leucocoprinus birnbaumii]